MKTVLITGATRNTGYGIAKLFAERGWRVVVTSKSPESVDNAVKLLKEQTGGDIIGFAHDVRQTDKVEELFQKVKNAGYTPDSVVLNGAMLGVGTDPLEIPIDEWAEVLYCNVVGNFAVARTFAKDMVKLIDLNTGEILTESKEGIMRYLEAYEGNYTLEII